ncbi:hypothetical protein N0V90_001170 [Kalmusia sp. IMI 367209]|nr:hypothetical protein N0V90_001170 [Kalmusia sp. IMI 367209]
MPDRQILDFLIQYFATEVNWMDQLVYLPWFLGKYQAWWNVKRITHVVGVDFAVLILRICSYTLQFLPSPGYTLDTIRGVSLAEIRNVCDDTADSLETISTAADNRGSLIRVQHVAFFGLQCQIEAKANTFWEGLGRAIRIAQNIGIHCFSGDSKNDAEKLEREMERKTFCNLFIWDSLLSRQLDRIPTHPERLRSEDWLKLHQLRSSSEDDNTDPSNEGTDPFTERLLQAHLADFWRSFGPMQATEYDMIAAEERYDKLCNEYLPQLPPTFALKDADETCDKRYPKLPLQRQLLHIAIYDSICWNFRPLFLRQPTPLPVYKSLILSSQKAKLAAAALLTLASITRLHALLGDCHTRLASMIFSTFEAAVVLLFIYKDPLFEEDCPPQHLPPPGTLQSDPLQATMCNMSKAGCLEAVKGALKRLKMLAEVSSMADVAANTLSQLMSNTIVSVESRSDTEEIPAAASVATETTTIMTSQPGPAFAVGGELAQPWLSVDLNDLRGVNEEGVVMNGALALGDIASWPVFDTANMGAQQPWMHLQPM